ncbi:MAG: hypothetical protein NTZ78_15100 [Candidatus Aureabacteria bacterium]|nr:hypothetical protein [Candidatus Auribacterota bacterium]
MKPEQITLSEEDRRLVGRWAADCAERVLTLFEAKAPSDTRPREAIEGIRVFSRGGKRTARLRSLALAALAAAREVDEPAATAAARAAGLAASIAYMHALACPHQAKHALGPAVYGARARELSAVDDPRVGDQEIRWAIKHASPAVREVVRRFPIQVLGRTRLSALYYQLDTGLRAEQHKSIMQKKLIKAVQPTRQSRVADL